jgi:hypothetical protein
MIARALYDGGSWRRSGWSSKQAGSGGGSVEEQEGAGTLVANIGEEVEV